MGNVRALATASSTLLVVMLAACRRRLPPICAAARWPSTTAPASASPNAVLAVSVYQSDLGLHLSVRRGHSVLVLGYLGEQFLRIDPAGVAVNAASPTAAASGLLHAGEGNDRRAEVAGGVATTPLSGMTRACGSFAPGGTARAMEHPDRRRRPARSDHR